MQLSLIDEMAFLSDRSMVLNGCNSGCQITRDVAHVHMRAGTTSSVFDLEALFLAQTGSIPSATFKFVDEAILRSSRAWLEVQK